jgi:hypothetical protein
MFPHKTGYGLHVFASDRDCEWIRKDCSALDQLMSGAQERNSPCGQARGVVHFPVHWLGSVQEDIERAWLNSAAHRDVPFVKLKVSDWSQSMMTGQ